MTFTPPPLTTPADEPLRVLFVAHSFPRHEDDGAGGFILRLAVALADRGVTVHALAPSAPGLDSAASLNGIAVTRFRYAPAAWETLAYTGSMIDETRRFGGLTMLSFILSARRAIARAAREHGSQIVHAHWWFPSGLAAASGSPVPLVTTMHGTDVRVARASSAARRALRWVLRRSSSATTVSSWLATEVVRMAPGASPVVAPMPAATELFSPLGPRDADLLLFVGRFNAQKGARHLLDAVARMREGVRLRLIGDGPDGDALHRQAETLGISGKLEWLPPQPQRELSHHYRQAGVVVVPSIEEGLGMVAVEAQLCEAPVVASASGGLRDVIDDGRTGVLVPPSEPEPLARALDSLLAEPARAAALGQAGRRAALAVFAPDAVAARYAEIYTRAINAR
ncbi:MAG TPA: glycosyltransferase family 4 protein [Gemmatimonadaceae bacterium]|nr:glycosyltransferase family 4 protein [Gemmatimonadaceae bacterium]